MATTTLRAFALVATAVLLVQSAKSANFNVGGTAGSWDLNTNLNRWASAQTFTTGDTLTFNYDSMHSVLEVSKADYDACQVNNPIGKFTNGNTVIMLKSPGKRYFICGTGGHCGSGMKLEIDTVAAAVATPPPASPVTPSSPPPTSPPPNPKPSPELPSPPPKGRSQKPQVHPPRSPIFAPLTAPSRSPSAAAEPVQPLAPSSPSLALPPFGAALAPRPSAAENVGREAKIVLGFAVGVLMLSVL
ncbi:putative Blue (type 1) copper binding protein [Dioscorea sansibarensis]